MEKIKIKTTVYEKIDYRNPIRVKEFKDILQDDDIIESGYEEPYEGSDSGYNGHFFVYIIRWRLETDEEFEKRKKGIEFLREKNKKMRYNKYLELKKEFEDD
jgi:hypothetical protein